MRLPANTEARYLGEGCYRIAYGLEAGGVALPYVLKVDRNVSRPSVFDNKVYRPWGLGHPGCDTEAQVYKRVVEGAPDLTPYLAAIHAHGPGWLIQERLEDVGVCEVDDGRDLRNLAAVFLSRLDLKILDLGGLNVGRRRKGDRDLVILDYACVAL